MGTATTHSSGGGAAGASDVTIDPIPAAGSPSCSTAAQQLVMVAADKLSAGDFAGCLVLVAAASRLPDAPAAQLRQMELICQIHAHAAVCSWHEVSIAACSSQDHLRVDESRNRASCKTWHSSFRNGYQLIRVMVRVRGRIKVRVRVGLVLGFGLN